MSLGFSRLTIRSVCFRLVLEHLVKDAGAADSMSNLYTLFTNDAGERAKYYASLVETRPVCIRIYANCAAIVLAFSLTARGFRLAAVCQAFVAFVVNRNTRLAARASLRRLLQVEQKPTIFEFVAEFHFAAFARVFGEFDSPRSLRGRSRGSDSTSVCAIA